MEFKMRRFAIAILFSLSLNVIRAQVPEDIRLTIERYLETLETNADYTQIYEDLTAFIDKPVNLNRATVDELLNFPLITPVQSTAIVSHREKYGLFLHISELQVLGFTPDQIKALQIFVNISPNAGELIKNFGNSLPLGKLEWVNTVKRRYPDPTEIYAGDLFQASTRLRYTLAGRYSFGITAEKDPGELWWKNGPDYLSAHAAIYNLGVVKTLVAGDYLLSLGQGLVMGSGIGIGKSASVLNIKRAQPALKAYRGVNEFLFLRGLATTLRFGKLEITAATAQNALNARLGDTATFGNSFTSVDLDGLHRNNAELAGKAVLSRRINGLWLNRNGRKGNAGLGMTHFQTNLAQEISDDLYKLFYPAGKTQTFVHAWQGHTLGRLHLFSEWARQLEEGKNALAAGALISLGKWTELALHYRDYSPGFISPFSTSFGNSAQNERGFYSGIKVNFTRKISLSHYSDVWIQPWLNSRLFAPSYNTEMLWQLDVAVTKKTQMYLRMRQLNRPISETAGQMKGTDQYSVRMIRGNITAQVSEFSRMELRVEHSLNTTKGVEENSSLFYAEYTGRLRKSKTQLIARYTLFNISGFYNRIYAYENQLLYDFGTVGFYGKGQSAYLLLSKNLTKTVKIGLRYATMNSVNSSGEPSVGQRIFAQIIWKP
jgi:hypothetical protein